MADLQIIITGENQSSAAFASLKKDLGDVGAGADAAKEKGTGFFSGLLQTAGGFLAANVLGNIAGQMTSFVTDGIAAAQNTAKLMASTQQTITTMGNAAGVSAQHVADMATALSDAAGKSLFGDDQIQQSENLLLTFGEIKGKTLDTATALTVDLAAALGGAPKDQAMMLGKALNDPIKGISALGKAGLTFSEEQKAAITAMQESGNMAGAQAIITAELTKQVGGQAEAQAKAAGGMVQFKARMGEVSESIGAALLPALNKIGGMLSDSVAPAIEAAAGWLGDKLPIAIDKASTFWTNSLQPALKMIWTFLSANLIPIINDLVKWLKDNLPPVIAALADYWTNTLQPALEAVWKFIQDNVIPIIDDLVKVAFAILKEDIKILAALWTNVLWPALQKVWQFIDKNILPILATLIVWLKDNLPPAIKFLADLWNNTLLPALTATWQFIDTKILPVLRAIGDVINAVLGVAFKFLAGLLTNTIIPAFEHIWSYLDKNVLPVFKSIGNVLMETVGPAFAWLGTVLSPIVDYFSNLLGNVQSLITWLEELAKKISAIHIPSWAGGSGGDSGGSSSTPPAASASAAGARSFRGAGITASDYTTQPGQMNVIVSFDGRGADLLRQMIRVEVQEIMGASGKLSYNRMRTGG